MQKNSKKVFSFIVLAFVFINFLGIFNVNALSISDEINDKNVITINEIGNFKVTNNLNGIEVKHSLANCGSSLLGNPEDPDSVAWLLQKLLNYIKVLGPILVIVLSSVDFLKVIIKSDDDAMTTAGKKLGYRLILAGLLFFIPTIVQVLLGIFGLTSDPTCGIN
jgi:hypothetical protein